MAAALTVGVIAQGAATKALPLDDLGLEHLDIIVPDPAASAGFYAPGNNGIVVEVRVAQ